MDNDEENKATDGASYLFLGEEMNME